MNVEIISKEEITKLLNDWYQAIISQRVLQSNKIKEEIADKINNIKEDQTILVYYALLNARYNLLIRDMDSSKDILDKIEPLQEPTETFLEYYHHLFKAIYATNTANHSEARMQFEEAEKYLEYMHDEIEKAEFNYWLAVHYYHILKPILAVQFAMKANEVFSISPGYELKTAACLNTLGMAHTRLSDFESAEEYLLSALGTFQKSHDESLTKRVKHNLGLLYASQNMSELAIKHLEESLENNAKTMFLLAREHFKLGHNHNANEYIENGYKISDLCYRHHFQILKAVHNYAPQEELEKVVMEGISYFEKEELYDWVKEYAYLLGNIFYGSENHEKASKYLHIALDADKKSIERRALK
ncbi:tetratricopeptide repeat protein [Bacillus cereus group sp. Bce025]|nr:tetratricopeptide repeat protein [Bacillus cereus]MDA2497205.1 tetratricopeptide repeat protein [Bacillus cereus]MRC31840.1 tetratricopeptide repeat protein [Bacillus thuringiensis]